MVSPVNPIFRRIPEVAGPLPVIQSDVVSVVKSCRRNIESDGKGGNAYKEPMVQIAHELYDLMEAKQRGAIIKLREMARCVHRTRGKLSAGTRTPTRTARRIADP